MEKEKQFSFDLWGIMELAFIKRVPLLIIIAITVILSATISYLIPSRFESTVVLFPSSSGSVSEALLSKNYASKDLLKFGTEEEVEQFLQILKSDDIRNRIIEKFNLMEHYRIDPTGVFPKTKLYQQYEDNVSIRRTEFNSIKVSVLDEDPETAALIATDIADLGDSLIFKIQRSRAMKAFKLVEGEYMEVQRILASLHDSLKSLRDSGIYEYESQAEVYNQAYADALIKGNQSAANEIDKKMKVLAKYGGNYSALRNQVIYETERMGLLRGKYMEAKVDVDQDLPHKFIVSQAEIPEKKSYPIRWLIVLVSVIATFFFALMTLVILENLKKKRFLQPTTTTTTTNPPVQQPIPSTPIPWNFRIPKIKSLSYTINYDTMEQFFRNKLLMKIITKWKIHLGIIFVISIIAGIFISSPMVITPLYKSDAIVYPVNIFAYSEESETEQMLQIMRSADIKLKMLDAFQLDKHYDLKKSTPGFMAYFMNKYDDRVSINKTEYEAVMISVKDQKAEIAKAMVDSILMFYNQKVAYLLRSKQFEMAMISKGDMNKKKAEVDSLTNLLKKWNQEYGIVDVRAQTWGVINSRTTENNKLFEVLKEKGIDYKSTDSLLTSARKEFIAHKGVYEKSMSEYKKDISYVQIVSNPIVSDKKAFPIRWIIVTLTTLVTLILSLIAISIIESSNKKEKN